MDFQSRGYGLQEGEARLVASGITDRLIGNSRVRIVERSILDRLLEEMKLGASKLAEPGTALSLGRIMSARLILSGQIVYSGADTQVAMRLIETETGQVTAAINEIFRNSDSPAVITEKLSEICRSKLLALYPLRGKLSEIRKDEVVLNIGEIAGVKVGQSFRVLDKDLILEVSAVDKTSSKAKVKGDNNNLQIGARVEAM